MMECREIPRCALVTGANKGIGYAIVKGLCERFDGLVYLTARNVVRGEAAVKKLENLGLSPLFHQLDISDKESIETLKEDIIKEHGGIDILINNAAIYREESQKLFGERAEQTVKVNYFSTLQVCEVLFPILRQNARVIHLSSTAGHLKRIPSAQLRSKLGDPSLTLTKLNDLMLQFIESAANGTNVLDGWGSSAYAVSKVGINALTIIQQREFDKEQPFRNISVNCCHPGYVKTDLTNHRGNLSIEEGAQSTLYLALENHSLKGKYVMNNNRVVDWT